MEDEAFPGRAGDGRNHVTAVEFVAAEIAEPANDRMGGLGEELPAAVAGLGLVPEIAVVAADA